MRDKNHKNIMTWNSVDNYCHWYTIATKPKSTYSTSACCLMVVYFLWSAPVRAIDSDNPDLCGNSSSHANIDIVISVFHCVIMLQTIQYRAVYHPLNIVGVISDQRLQVGLLSVWYLIDLQQRWCSELVTFSIVFSFWSLLSFFLSTRLQSAQVSIWLLF